MGRHIIKYRINSLLPSGYNQLEYIQSTGNQYINTGWIPSTSNFGIKFKFNRLTIQSSNAPCGSEHNISTWRWLFTMYPQGKTDGGMDFLHGTLDYQLHQTVILAAYTDYVIDWNYDGTTKTGTIKIDDTEPITSTNTGSEDWSTIDTPLNIFCNTTGQKSTQKIYYFQCLENGVPVRNFIPAERLSDGKVGLYDTITNTFFESATTGSYFIKGPIVKSESRGLVLTRTGETPPEVPEGYTAVQSIYSNGYQYFETAWIPDFTKDFTVEGKVGFVTSGRGMWIANYGGTGESSFSIELNANLYLRFYNGGDICTLATGAVLDTLYDAVITYTASTGVVNMRYSTSAITVSGTLPVDRRKLNTATAYFGTDRSGHRYPYGLYGPVKVTQGGVEILNYQPAKRNSDGAYGMWDYTTNQFYESETTTGFLGNEYVIDIKAHAIKTAEVNN